MSVRQLFIELYRDESGVLRRTSDDSSFEVQHLDVTMDGDTLIMDFDHIGAYWALEDMRLEDSGRVSDRLAAEVYDTLRDELLDRLSVHYISEVR